MRVNVMKMQKDHLHCKFQISLKCLKPSKPTWQLILAGTFRRCTLINPIIYRAKFSTDHPLAKTEE